MAWKLLTALRVGLDLGKANFGFHTSWNELASDIVSVQKKTIHSHVEERDYLISYLASLVEMAPRI